MMMSFQPIQLLIQTNGEATLLTAGMPGPAGVKGDTGATGATGLTGATGVGIPTGGTTGQALLKNSSTNYDTAWQTIPTVAVIIQDSVTQSSSTWSSQKIQTQLDTKASTTHNHNSLYAPIASGIPTGGTTGQILTKTSNADYADAWQTLINTSAEFDLTGVSWNSGTPPTATGSLRGRYVEMGSLVAISVRLEYGSTTVQNISVSIAMDGQFPLAQDFTGVDSANEVIIPGIGIISTSEAPTTSTNSSFVCIRRNPNNTGQEIFIRSSATAALKFASAMLLYRKA